MVIIVFSHWLYDLGPFLIEVWMHTKIASLECIAQDECLTLIFLLFIIVILLDWREFWMAWDSTFIKAEILTWHKRVFSCMVYLIKCMHQLKNFSLISVWPAWNNTDWNTLLPRGDNVSTQLISWENNEQYCTIRNMKHIPWVFCYWYSLLKWLWDNLQSQFQKFDYSTYCHQKSFVVKAGYCIVIAV